jgi:hypothetical protein
MAEETTAVSRTAAEAGEAPVERAPSAAETKTAPVESAPETSKEHETEKVNGTEEKTSGKNSQYRRFRLHFSQFPWEGAGCPSVSHFI